MSRVVDACGVCFSTDLGPVLDLGSSPPTCYMPKIGERPPSEEHHPLVLMHCNNCGLAQLSVVVEPERNFPPDYPYSSGNSKALHQNFEDLAAGVAPMLRDDDLVVDIGANDGTLLSKFPTPTLRKVGVEPTAQVERIAEVATCEGVYQAFFNEDLAEEIVAGHGKAQVVTACNVLAHVDDVHEVMRGIVHLLADDGVLIAENHDLASVVDGQWDTVYHEHLRIYSPASFAHLLDMHDLCVAEWKSISTHGGSFRATAQKGNNGVKVERLRYDFTGLAREAVSARAAIREVVGSGVWGIGATARATTIINYCGLDVEDLECVCEVQGSDKIGHYIPGTRIPVIDERLMFAEQPAAALLFSWHLADSIVPKLRERGYEGTIYVPLPTLQEL